MTPERERYEQMTAPASWWQRIKRLFVFPPMVRFEPPPPAEPRYLITDRFLPGYPNDVAYLRDLDLPPVMRAAPSLDDLHPAFAEPVIGYMSLSGYTFMRDIDDWWTQICRKPEDLNPKTGVVEVEIRVLRRVQ
jgi:hypothetical protein